LVVARCATRYYLAATFLGVGMKSLALLGALAFIIGQTSVHAQTWPNRPVTLVVPYPAGGSQDVVVRLLSPGLTAALGQQVVVPTEN
jgi:tripartite-type tricarboxylate transporter receptor subunit TctC